MCNDRMIEGHMMSDTRVKYSRSRTSRGGRHSSEIRIWRSSVVPGFCVRYNAKCESWSDERDPVEGSGADVGAEVATEDLGAYGPWILSCFGQVEITCPSCLQYRHVTCCVWVKNPQICCTRFTGPRDDDPWFGEPREADMWYGAARVVGKEADWTRVGNIENIRRRIFSEVNSATASWD